MLGCTDRGKYFCSCEVNLGSTVGLWPHFRNKVMGDLDLLQWGLYTIEHISIATILFLALYTHSVMHDIYLTLSTLRKWWSRLKVLMIFFIILCTWIDFFQNRRCSHCSGVLFFLCISFDDRPRYHVHKDCWPVSMMTSSNGNISALLLFVRGIHRWPVNSPHKGQWRGALMFSLTCAWINDWVNNRGAGDLRRHRAH